MQSIKLGKSLKKKSSSMLFQNTYVANKKNCYSLDGMWKGQKDLLLINAMGCTLSKITSIIYTQRLESHSVITAPEGNLGIITDSHLKT